MRGEPQRTGLVWIVPWRRPEAGKHLEGMTHLDTSRSLLAVDHRSAKQQERAVTRPVASESDRTLSTYSSVLGSKWPETGSTGHNGNKLVKVDCRLYLLSESVAWTLTPISSYLQQQTSVLSRHRRKPTLNSLARERERESEREREREEREGERAKSSGPAAALPEFASSARPLPPEARSASDPEPPATGTT